LKNGKLILAFNKNKSKEDLIKEIQSLKEENDFLKSVHEANKRQTTDSIKESEDNFKIIFERSLSAMVIADDNGNYIAVNNAASELLGYSIQELLRMNVGELVTISNPSAIERYAEYIRKGEEIGEFDCVSKDGIPKIVKYQAIRLKPNFNLSIMMDITEIKKNEQEQKINLQKLETLNKTKDKFFSIIAHDLRNPFIGIVRLSELIESNLKQNKQQDSSLMEYTRIIRTSSQSGYELLENLMQWAKSQTDQIEYHPEPLSIHQLISKSVALIKGNAFNKNISIEVIASKDEAVLADETLTSTVLRNLLTNAIKFTNSNGKITITTKQKDSFLEISIKDTGVGIEKENLTKIFTVDSKFSSLGTNNETGTGLGLILCKEFVEMQGGKIYAESNLGIGSEFSFTLPLS